MKSREEIDSLMEGKQHVHIYVHDYPDPDAIGSALAIKLLAEQIYDKSVTIFGQHISHPQNRTMVNVLDITIENPEPEEMWVTDQEDLLNIWVDFNSNSGNFKFGKKRKLSPDWVIDHHVDKDKQNGNTEAVGACCTLVTEYLQKFNIDLKEREGVATALMLGLVTDTNNLLYQSVTQRDLKAFEYLKQYYDQDTFSAIMDYELNSYFYDLIAKAYETQVKEGSIAVLCLGYLKSERRDAIPFVADLWRRCKDISTVIAFAVIENAVVGSVRIKGQGDMKASDLAREIFRSPDSGGHSHMAGGTAQFGSFFDVELLDEDTRHHFLDAIMKIIVSRAKNAAQMDE